MRALLRFTPAYDARAFLDDAPSPCPELMVSQTAIRTLRPDVPTPVVVDHDLDRVVGHVRELYVHEDVDYGARLRKWWFASCEITDPPGWLKRGGGVSWSHKRIHARTVADTTVLECCLIEEISVLSADTTPVEPLAHVAWVGELEDSSAAGSRSRVEPAAGEVVLPGRGQKIVRVGCGQVLGVR